MTQLSYSNPEGYECFRPSRPTTCVVHSKTLKTQAMGDEPLRRAAEAVAGVSGPYAHSRSTYRTGFSIAGALWLGKLGPNTAAIRNIPMAKRQSALSIVKLLSGRLNVQTCEAQAITKWRFCQESNRKNIKKPHILWGFFRFGFVLLRQPPGLVGEFGSSLEPV